MMGINVRFLTRSAMMVAVSVAFQSFGFPQYITGPVINTILLLSAEIAGAASGGLVGLITPWAAVTTGIMPVPAVLPVIMAGNLAIVVTYTLLRRINRYLAGVMAAIVKAGVMAAGIQLLIAGGVKLPDKIKIAMTITQLYTALGGVVIFLTVVNAVEAFRRARETGGRA